MILLMMLVVALKQGTITKTSYQIQSESKHEL